MLWVTNPAFDIGEVSLYEIGWWILIILLIAIPVIEIVLSKQFNLKIWLLIAWTILYFFGLRING
jgi:phosphatidate cytidylyltransferase